LANLPTSLLPGIPWCLVLFNSKKSTTSYTTTYINVTDIQET
jgi:hypothetical protein